MTSEGQNKPPARRRPDFSQASAELAALDQEVQATEGALSNALIQLFAQAMVNESQGIDRRKSYAAAISWNIKAAKDEASRLKSWIAYQEEALEILKAKTLEDMQVVKAQIPDFIFRDTKGQKIWTQRSTPALKVKPTLGEKTVRNVIDWEEAQFFGIDGKYLKQVSFLVLDREKVKEDLLSGIEIGWASLEQSAHVRGLLPKEESNEDRISKG